jgi:hypothetical protein
METITPIENAIKAVEKINARLDLASPLLSLATNLTDTAVAFAGQGRLALATEMLAVANQIMDIANAELAK